MRIESAKLDKSIKNLPIINDELILYEEGHDESTIRSK